MTSPERDPSSQQPQGMEEMRQRRNARWIVVTAIVISCSYFFTGGGWNQSSHFDLVRAIVVQGTIRIDDYQENTGDKSYSEGHYYCNKAPGAALVATPFAWVADCSARALGEDPEGDEVLHWEARLATLGCASLSTAVAAMAIFFIGMHLGASFRTASFASIVFCLGTPAWVYGTLLWAHALVTACLLVAFACGVALARPVTNRQEMVLGFSIGFTAGWAVATEVQSGGAALIVMAFALWQGRSRGRRGILRLAMAGVLGALGPLLVLGVYNASAFGSPLRLSYSALVNFPGQREGFLGVTYPKPNILVELLFGSRRGLIFFAPVLLAAPMGFWAIWRQRRYWSVVIVSGAVFAYYLFLNASFHYWLGGWCYGARYMAPGAAFLCIGLACAGDSLGWKGWILALALGAVSVFMTLVGVSTNPTPPEELASPFQDLLWPSFVDGRLSLNQEPYFSTAPTPSYNCGEWMGLRGLASLLPLLMAWLLLGGLWIWNDRAYLLRLWAGVKIALPSSPDS